MARMKDGFDKLLQNISEAQIDRDLIWYLLFFIHPVRHELYYFDIHYPDGYSHHLAERIRSHRLGLKGAKKYLSKDGRTIDGSYLSSCGTMAFKQLHLHPTTSALEKPNLQDLKEESVFDLKIGTGDLSPDELEIAVALSARATMYFGRWIDYAQCAINEGPIFTLKEGKKHLNCFNELVKILQSADQNQDAMRAELEEYYEIEVTSELG
nr:hypothetical protein OHNDKECF_00001 [Methanosarcinales archaeon ANME-2c ERB4]